MNSKYPYLLFEVLAASYAYYYLDTSLMSDEEYDLKARELYSMRGIRSNNKLDRLINWKEFANKTSLYYIKESKYPQGLKRIVKKWAVLIE
jgi:NAD-dependent DNA ligase